MKRAKKRYIDEADVVAAIDRKHQDLKDSEIQWEIDNELLIEKRRMDPPGIECSEENTRHFQAIEELEESLAKLHRKIVRIQKNTLPRLKDRLAVIQTTPLPGVLGDDESVEA